MKLFKKYKKIKIKFLIINKSIEAMINKINKEKEKKLSTLLPKNLLIDLDEIPFSSQEKVINF